MTIYLVINEYDNSNPVYKAFLKENGAIKWINKQKNHYRFYIKEIEVIK